MKIFSFLDADWHGYLRLRNVLTELCSYRDERFPIFPDVAGSTYVANFGAAMKSRCDGLFNPRQNQF